MQEMTEVAGQLTMVEAAVAADLHLALDVNAERIRELESVEKGVGNDGGPLVRSFSLEESADHFRAQYAAVFVGKLDDMPRAVRGGARLHSHVEFSCKRQGNCR